MLSVRNLEHSEGGPYREGMKNILTNCTRLQTLRLEHLCAGLWFLVRYEPGTQQLTPYKCESVTELSLRSCRAHDIDCALIGCVFSNLESLSLCASPGIGDAGIDRTQGFFAGKRKSRCQQMLTSPLELRLAGVFFIILCRNYEADKERFKH